MWKGISRIHGLVVILMWVVTSKEEECHANECLRYTIRLISE